MFAYKSLIKHKIENIFCRSKLAIKYIRKNPKSTVLLTKTKVRPECSISILPVLIFLFSNLFTTQIVEI